MMPAIALPLAAVLTAFLLAACASAPLRPAGPAPVWITNQKAVAILPPAALPAPLELQQQIEGDFQGQTYVMQTVVDAAPDHFSLYALNAFGTQVFELQYEASGVRYSTGLPIPNFKAEYLLADWQLCFFPAEAVAGMLKSAGLDFEESRADGGAWTRSVRDGGATIIEIAGDTAGTVRYRNLLRGYAYTITQGN
jgi:hypothetical protein